MSRLYSAVKCNDCSVCCADSSRSLGRLGWLLHCNACSVVEAVDTWSCDSLVPPRWQDLLGDAEEGHLHGI